MIMPSDRDNSSFNPIALRKAKTPLSFGCSECNRVNVALFRASSHRSDNQISHILALDKSGIGLIYIA